MKSFYVSLIAFALLLLAIIWNAHFVRQTTEDLISQLNALPNCEQAADAFEKAQNFWEARKGLIALTTSHTDIEALDVQFTQIEIALQTKDYPTFERARALAIEATRYLYELEKFSIDNLL